MSEKFALAAFHAYLPKEHHKFVEWKDGKVVISSEAETIYGSATNLAEIVEFFRTFPGSHNLFGCELTEPILIYKEVFKSLYKESFFFKQSAFVFLFQIVNEIEKSPEVLAMISWFIRAKEQEMNGICELIPYKEDEYVKLITILQSKLAKLSDTVKLKTLTLDGLVEKFKEILPQNEKDPEYDAIRKVVMESCQKKSVKKNFKYYEAWINRTHDIVEVLSNFMRTRKTWFNPKPINLESSKNKGPAIVRVFDIEHGIVLARELLIEMFRAKLDTSSIKHEFFEVKDLDTIDYLKICGAIGVVALDVQYVLVPVTRVKHRAVFIPTIEGRYFISSSDAVAEILHELISVKMIFQNLEEDTFLKICSVISRHVIQTCKNAKFVYIEQVAGVKEAIIRDLQQKLPELFASDKVKVRRVKGFSVKYLENELTCMGFVKTFPDILEYTKDVFKQIDKNKQERFLTISDMYDALEYCQRVVILKNCAELVNILHVNGACCWLGISCPDCVDESERIQLKTLKSALETDTDTDDQVKDLAEQLVYINLEPHIEKAKKDKLLAPDESISIFDYTDRVVKSENTLFSVLNAYLPPEHQDLIEWVKERIQFKVANPKFGMYGSISNLIDYAKQFMRFSGSSEFFQGELTDAFLTEPIVYKSLNGIKYVSKHDALLFLFECVERCESRNIDLVVFYIRAREKFLKASRDLIQYHPHEFQKFEKDLLAELFHVTSCTSPIKFEDYTFEGVFQQLKGILPYCAKETDYNCIHNCIKEAMLEKSGAENLLNRTNIIINHLDKFIQDQKWFDPKPTCLLNPEIDGPGIVRVFESGDQRFVLASEVSKSIYTAGLEFFYVRDQFSNLIRTATINFLELPEKIGEELMEKIVFVITPIPTSKHRAVYIPSLSGEYLVSTVHMVKELLHDIISVKCLFQNASSEVDEIRENVKYAVTVISTLMSKHRLAPLRSAFEFHHLVMQRLKRDAPTALTRPKLDVVKVGDEGFTEKDLEKELIRLRILHSFPDILSRVSAGYQVIYAKKTGSVLQTSDMYDALEWCQTAHLLQESRQMISAVHDIGGCSVFDMPCDLCQEGDDNEPSTSGHPSSSC